MSWLVFGMVAGVCAHADQTFTVTNNADSGTGSLRWALTEPCTGVRTVNFGISDTIIVLQSTLTITGEVVIAGVEHSAGDGSPVNGYRITISGGGTVRPFMVLSGASLRLQALTVADGKATSPNGGAIYNYQGTVKAVRCAFLNNTASQGGVVINDGGSVFFNSCTLSGNSATRGGVIYNRNGGTARLQYVTASENSATELGGVIYSDGGSVMVHRSILWDNPAPACATPPAYSTQIADINGATVSVTQTIIEGGYPSGDYDPSLLTPGLPLGLGGDGDGNNYMITENLNTDPLLGPLVYPNFEESTSYDPTAVKTSTRAYELLPGSPAHRAIYGYLLLSDPLRDEDDLYGQRHARSRNETTTTAVGYYSTLGSLWVSHVAPFVHGTSETHTSNPNVYGESLWEVNTTQETVIFTPFPQQVTFTVTSYMPPITTYEGGKIYFEIPDGADGPSCVIEPNPAPIAADKTVTINVTANGYLGSYTVYANDWYYPYPWGEMYRGLPIHLTNTQAPHVVVTNDAEDMRVGSLRWAVESVRTGGLITFDGDYTFNITEPLKVRASIDGEDNTIVFNGGGASAIMEIDANSTMVFKNFTVENGFIPTNESFDLLWAAGVRLTQSAVSADISFVNVVFRNNVSDFGAAFSYHYFDPDFPLEKMQFINCLFEGNHARKKGGAITAEMTDGPADFINCTFVGNTAGEEGGVVYNQDVGIFGSGFSQTFTNCIFWDNTAPQYPIIRTDGGSATISFSHSNVQNAFPSGSWDATLGINGGDNIAADPQFINAAGGDYRIGMTSPCLDAGDNAAVPVNVTEDLLGDARIFNGIVDMGAYEYGPTTSSFTVTNAADSGVGTLRWALTEPSLAGRVVNIALPDYSTITLSSPLSISDASIIRAATRVQILGDGSTRLFNIAPGASLQIEDLTIGNGYATNGGAIYNEGTLSIIRSLLLGNSATNGGAIYNTGTVLLSNSTLSSNRADWGGCVYNAGGDVKFQYITACENQATVAGSVFSCDGGMGRIHRSILWDNSAPAHASAPNNPQITEANGASVAVYQTVIEGGHPGYYDPAWVPAGRLMYLHPYNIDEDPLLMPLGYNLYRGGGPGEYQRTRGYMPKMGSPAFFVAAVDIGTPWDPFREDFDDTPQNNNYTRNEVAAIGAGSIYFGSYWAPAWFEAVTNTEPQAAMVLNHFKTITLRAHFEDTIYKTENAGDGDDWVVGSKIYFVAPTGNEASCTISPNPAIVAPDKTVTFTCTANGYVGDYVVELTRIYPYEGAEPNNYSPMHNSESAVTFHLANIGNPHLVVTNNADDGPGSLRWAVENTASGGLVTFDNDYTITVTRPIEIGHAVTIDGGTNTIVVSGGSSSQVMRTVNVPATIRNITIANGKSVGWGGGIDVQAPPSVDTTVEFDRVIFRDNQGVGAGGAIGLSGGSGCQVSLKLLNCLFEGNSAGSWGGGALFVYEMDADATVEVVNCTFVGNASTTQGGAIYNYAGFGVQQTYENCVFWGNTAPTAPAIGTHGSATITVANSDVQGTFPAGVVDGGGNIAADPLFMDAASGDYRLGMGSPCINAGNNAVVAGTSDLAGAARIIDSTVDMGAYEAYIIAVTFHGNGGTPETTTGNYIEGLAYGTFPEVTRLGHSFAGWATSGGGTVTEETLASGMTTDLYAQWTANQYTVTFVKEGGSGGTDSVTATYGLPMPAATAPSRTGYTFVGYFGGYANNTQYYNADMTSAQTYWMLQNAWLDARWTANTYSAAYDGNGATSGSTVSSVHTYDTGATLNPNGFSRLGFIFSGWNTSADGMGTAYADGASVLNLTATAGATVTLYAQWVAANVGEGGTISYTDSNGLSPRGTPYVDGYVVHTFTNVGSAIFTVPDGYGDLPVEYLIVGGGGSGGSTYGGGGGAGGLLTNLGGTPMMVAAGDHAVVVGSGGAGVSEPGSGNLGESSSAFGLTANGGGAGGGYGSNGGVGGSGGGASKIHNQASTFTGGDGTTGQGNDGGDAVGGLTLSGGGGGGGAGASGGAVAGTNVGGAGGVGVQSSISGTTNWYAAGGSGIFNATSASGIGGKSQNGAPAGAGAVNTGSGGGGDTGSGSGAGGSGIVIIRYKYVQLGVWSEDRLRDADFTTDSALIQTPAQLAQFAWLVNSGESFAGRTVTLTADIDLIPHEWVAIGTDAARFEGTFDGAGHTVRNVRIEQSGSDYQGLFGCVGSAGILRNLTVSDFDISGRNNVGAVAGYVHGSLSGCVAGAGTVQGAEALAGVAGVAHGTVANCASAATVVGGYYAGGVVAHAFGNVSNCSNSGAVSGQYVGGVLGRLVVGGTLLNSVNDGPVTGTKSAGGVARFTEISTRMENCLNTGLVSGPIGATGGLLGKNRSTLKNSYWKQTGTAPFAWESIADSGGSVSAIQSFAAAPGTLVAPVTVGGITDDRLSSVLNAWVLDQLATLPGLFGWTVGGADSYPELTEALPHKLTYVAGAGGSISGKAVQVVAQGADGEPVSAVADAGAVFTSWSDARSENPRTDAAISAALTVTAGFSSTGGVPIDWFAAHGISLADGEDWHALESRDLLSKGMSLQEEYAAMTDPADITSRFRMTQMEPGAPTLIDFEPNSPERVYSLFYSTTLQADDWWPVPGQQNIPGGAPLQDNRALPVFYRVKVAVPE